MYAKLVATKSPNIIKFVTLTNPFSGPEYLQHERLTALKNSSMPTTNKNLEISGHSVEIISTSSSDPHQRMHPVSEDELSAISAGNIL